MSKNTKENKETLEKEVFGPDQEAQIFGSEEEVKGVKNKVREETIEIKKSVLDSILDRLQKVEQKDLNTENVFDPLAKKEREFDVRVPFFNKDGKDYMILAYVPTKLPNGKFENWTFSHLDPVTKNRIDKATFKAVDLSDNSVSEITETNDMFNNMVRVEVFRVKKWEKQEVDTTPSNEVVEAVVYQENKSTGTIRPTSTGVQVRLSSKGEKRRFWIEFDGKEYEVSSDVINMK